MEKLITILDVHNSDFLVILSSFSILSIISFSLLWFYNRRKFRGLEHDLPADVVKSYIDSIIYNSNVLKESLFRGSTDFEMPKNSSSQESSATDEYKDKYDKANKDLVEKSSLAESLEQKLNQTTDKLKSSDEKIAELEAKLKELSEKQSESTEGAASSEELATMKAQLDEVSKEKDSLRERLQEYEIIEDDLANLKRLQQENEQLRKSLGEATGEEAPVTEEDSPSENSEEVSAEATALSEETGPTPEENSEKDLSEEPPLDNVTPIAKEENSEEETEEQAKAELESEGGEDEVEASKEDAKPVSSGNEADDLLREFEKMLG